MVRADGCFSTPSTSSTAISTIGSSRSSVLRAAEDAGAEALVLCDTNGGALPDAVERVVADVVDQVGVQVGIHCHNDSGCAVANSLAAVRSGASQVQGCVNGYGERSGNADLAATIPNLSLKLNVRTIPPERLERLTPVSHHIAELVNIAPNPQQPYVGSSVFAHKGGLHASAMARRRDLYEHVSPDLVGNGARVVVSEMAGRSTLALKAAELGLELDGEVLGSGARRAQAARARGLPLRGGRRVARAVAAPARRVATRLLQRRVVPGDHRPRHRGRPVDARGIGRCRPPPRRR